jgi:hypothetical protein
MSKRLSVRTGQASPTLTRAAFAERFAASFVDPEFDAERAAIGRLGEIAWQNYNAGRKAPLTRKAGKGYNPTTTFRSIGWTLAIASAPRRLQEEVRSVARAVANAVTQARAQRLSVPDAKLESPRPK